MCIRDRSRQARLKGTSSELNVSRIGVTEKLRVDPLITLDGIASMPPEVAGNRKISTSTLALGSSGSGSSVGLPVKPNREKIRAVLKMSNVIELQRQLLTTVMENEVSNCIIRFVIITKTFHSCEFIFLSKDKAMNYRNTL